MGGQSQETARESFTWALFVEAGRESWGPEAALSTRKSLVHYSQLNIRASSRDRACENRARTIAFSSAHRSIGLWVGETCAQGESHGPVGTLGCRRLAPKFPERLVTLLRDSISALHPGNSWNVPVNDCAPLRALSTALVLPAHSGLLLGKSLGQTAGTFGNGE